MHTYKATVTRDERWWMITIPELNGYVTPSGAINLSDTTQARRIADVPGTAVDFICTVTDRAPSEVSVQVSIVIGGIDVTARAAQVATDREEAARLAAVAQLEARELARDLTAHGVTVRDVGEVLWGVVSAGAAVDFCLTRRPASWEPPARKLTRPLGADAMHVKVPGTALLATALAACGPAVVDRTPT